MNSATSPSQLLAYQGKYWQRSYNALRSGWLR